MSNKTGKQLSRRQLLAGGVAVGVSAAVGLRTGVSAVQQSGAAAAEELALVNGTIHTMDGKNTIVQSISMRNGRFVSVGGAAPKRGPGIRIIDLKGRTVVPGIIDNHNHIVLMGNRPGYHTPLENAYSIADIQAIYAARAAGLSGGAWITTIGGFNQNHFFPSTETPRLP